MTNTSKRKALTHNDSNVIDVVVPGDLGVLVLAPDGVMRAKIVQSSRYRFHSLMTMPRLWFPDLISAGDVVIFEGMRGQVLEFDGDDTPHFWGREISVINFINIQFNDISNGGLGGGTRLFDLVGGNNFSFIIGRALGLSNFKSLGVVVDVGVAFTGPNLIIANLAGLTIRSSPGFDTISVMGSTRIENFSTAPDTTSATYTFIGDTESALVGAQTIRLGKPGNSAFHIDSASSGNYNLIGNHYPGLPQGEFFRPDVVESIVSQIDASIAVTDFADSTSDPGVLTTVNFGTIVDFTRGEAILIAGEAAYDGPHAIVSVASNQMSVDIAVVHSTSGSGTLDMVEHAIVGPTRYVRGETVTVTGTTDYNGTLPVLRRGDASFTLPQSFISSPQAGTVTSTGKTEMSSGVFCSANVVQPDSLAIGGVTVNGNVSGTVIAMADVYQAIDSTGGVTVTNEQRFTVVDGDAGVIRYDGLTPYSGTVTAILSSVKTGSTAEYRFTVSANGAIPAPGATPYATAFVKSGLNPAVLRVAVELMTSDTIQPMIRGVGTSDTVTIQELVFDTEM